MIVVGYLITRLRQLGWTERNAVLTSGLLRCVYHLYQGFGAGLGNLVMGVIFRVRVVPHRAFVAPGDRPRPDRHGGVRGLRRTRRPRGLAAVTWRRPVGGGESAAVPSKLTW